MTSSHPASSWRGYVNQLTYALDLRRRVEDTTITWIADDMIAQRTFTRPVADYRAAATAALESGERVTDAGDEDTERVARDFLAQLNHVLDERRPWPEPPFRQGDHHDWDGLRDSAVIGRVQLSPVDIAERLNRYFDSVRSEDDDTQALILRLRTGQVVALTSSSFTESGTDVRTHADTESTLAALRELTGLDVEPL